MYMEAAIRHMVAFKLVYAKDDPRTTAFFHEARRIFADIPQVRNFMHCDEISVKNGFDFGFSFDFMTPEDYAEYNSNPDHIRFVKEKWNVEVADFIEIDFREFH